MYRFMYVLLIIASGSMLATALHAQRDRVRRGAWVAGGAAPAGVFIDLPNRKNSRAWGISGFIQVGGTPSERGFVAVEGNYWRGTRSDTTSEYVAVMAVLNFYPSEIQPLFVKLGFGAGRWAQQEIRRDSVTNAVSGTRSLSATGFAVVVGAGYDFRVGNRVSVGPYFNYVYAPGQSLKANRIAQITRPDLNVLQFGGRVNWH